MPCAVWAAIYVGIAAATLPAVLPVMVGVVADRLGLGLERAGYVASANMAGIALGSVFGAALTRRWAWKRVVIWGVALMIGGNLLTMIGSAFSYIAATRLASGLGEGLVAGICYAAMGRSGQPTRALAFYSAGQGLIGAVGMGFIPTVVEHAGWQILFVLISMVALPAFWLAGPIGSLHAPVAMGVTGHSAGPMIRPERSWQGWAAVAMIFAQFVGLSSLWAFLERLGHFKGIDPFHLSLALSASAIASMAGSLAVGLFVHRLSGWRGVALAFGLFGASIAAVFASDEWPVYCAAGVALMLSWALYFPIEFGLLARFDRSGSLAAIMPAVTGAGFTVGPGLGGVFMARGGTGAILALGLGCMILSTLACLGLQGIAFRRTGS